MNIVEFLKAFTLEPSHSPGDASEAPRQTEVEWVEVDGRRYPRLINEYWTSRQRQSSSLHEIAYRACFKAQLPRFFIRLLTSPGDVVFDPFSGRGTTIIEAALLNRRVIANDINPLSEILCRPRLFIPRLSEIETRLSEIPVDSQATADRDLSMFYHPRTEAEIVSLRRYLHRRRLTDNEDAVDAWIRMVATNRLTGHSPGFFSVYTLPPNQAVSPERQRLINARRNQQPPYRDTRALILRKSRSLLRHIDEPLRRQLHALGASARFLTADARSTPEIPSQSVDLIVTSPPFLNVVQYAADNWLRCW
ncbi:MAG: site-specific DNA-methyltransferase, partial [Calditrichaeota bacterium]